MTGLVLHSLTIIHYAAGWVSMRAFQLPKGLPKYPQKVHHTLPYHFKLHTTFYFSYRGTLMTSIVHVAVAPLLGPAEWKHVPLHLHLVI